MKYFLPEWDDRVDPRYDFLTDTYSDPHSKDQYENDSYIWDVFGIDKVPIDGVLVSRSKLEENKSKMQRVAEKGIHRFLHLPLDFEVMGDCGAFGYIEKDEPPYTSEDTLRFYLDSGFNYGVSVDHLIVPAFEAQKEQRWKMTIENAREMYEVWTSKEAYNSKLRIIGAAQGWDVASYRKAVRELLQIGYDYVGLGGLARTQSGDFEPEGESKTLCNIVRGACYEARKWSEKNRGRVDIHIFGFARSRLLEEFQKMGISSFDSASHLRSAWLSGKNYFTSSKNYKALRVTDPNRGTRVKRLLEASHFTREGLADLSGRTMNALRSYDKDVTLLYEALELARNLGKQVEVHPSHLKGYEETLRERPWKLCDCPICKSLGIDVAIFRGNERNRRRGFHNTYIFYKAFREQLPRTLVFTSCTSTKAKGQELLPAYRRYLASPIFNTFWKQVYDLPVEVKILSAKYGLIDWSSRIPYYDHKLDENDIERFVKELKSKLQRYNKIFFIGLGLYREAVEKVKDETGFDIEVFPKAELTNRPSLDIIEYTKQMTAFRMRVVEAVKGFHSASDIQRTHQALLSDYIE